MAERVLRRYALEMRREWIRDDPMDKEGPGFGILASEVIGRGEIFIWRVSEIRPKF